MSTATPQRQPAVPPVCWVLLAVVVCLGPFLNKAVHIDDTLFLRVAEQIRKHPGDFYGSRINWFGTSIPMTEAFDNPPLTSYYIALVSLVAGWSEVTLHLAFLLPALAAAWGSYRLAGYYCGKPMLAALITVLAPVFLISASTLMCDVMLLAFWVWALVFLEKGLEKRDKAALAISGVLAGLAILTKFTGLALIPLMGAYALTREGRPGWWLVSAAIPVLFAAGYEWITHRLYGQGLLGSAAGYAAVAKVKYASSLLTKTAIGFSYTGGCFLPVLFYAPRLWDPKSIMKGAFVIVPCAILLTLVAKLERWLGGEIRQPQWGLFLQSVIFITGGIHILVLAWSDFLERRDPQALLLVLWVTGIFVFATGLNWTVNGRSFLPAIPAAGILVARRLERREASGQRARRWAGAGPALAAGVISLCLVKADYDSAEMERTLAQELCAKYERPGRTIWFQGHWGFQYYMEKLGAKPHDFRTTRPKTGDILILPYNSTNVGEAPKNWAHFVEVLERKPNAHWATMSQSVGAGFYAALWAPLPFVVGNPTPDRICIYEAN